MLKDFNIWGGFWLDMLKNFNISNMMRALC